MRLAFGRGLFVYGVYLVAMLISNTMVPCTGLLFSVLGTIILVIIFAEPISVIVYCHLTATQAICLMRSIFKIMLAIVKVDLIMIPFFCIIILNVTVDM